HLQDGPDPHAHEEQADDPVEHLQAASHRVTGRVGDADGDEADEAVEHVEPGHGVVVARHQRGAGGHLDQQGDLGGYRGDEHPAAPPAGDAPGGEGHEAGQGVADDGHPGPVLVEGVERFDQTVSCWMTSNDHSSLAVPTGPWLECCLWPCWKAALFTQLLNASSDAHRV